MQIFIKEASSDDEGEFILHVEEAADEIHRDLVGDLVGFSQREKVSPCNLVLLPAERQRRLLLVLRQDQCNRQEVVGWSEHGQPPLWRVEGEVLQVHVVVADDEREDQEVEEVGEVEHRLA